MRGLGFAPLALAATAVKSEAIGKALSGFKSAIGGIFGDTATDRQRKSECAGYLERALNGDGTALSWLLGRSGIVVDPNVKVAPESVKHLYRTALRTYYTATSTVPSDTIARGLGWQTAQQPTAAFPPVPGTTPSVPVPLTAVGGQLPSSTLPSWLIPALAVGGVVLLLSRRSAR